PARRARHCENGDRDGDENGPLERQASQYRGHVERRILPWEVSYPERIVPARTSPGILALHLKRYEFALGWCESADVLDAACGVGYGSAFLAEVARRVVGVDRSPEALAYARSEYARPNVEFVEGDLLTLPLPDGEFDVVCAFEAIEHVDDQRGFLREAARVLRAGGTMLVSTPRVERTEREPANPFHRV